MNTNNDIKNKHAVRVVVKWLGIILKDNWKQTSINALAGLLEVAVSLSNVWAVKHAIDVASGNIPGSVYIAVGLIALLILCDFAINILKVWIRNTLGVKAKNRMQQKTLDRILRSHIEGKDKYHSGDIINRLENDVKGIVDFLTETIPETLSVILLFLGAFIYLFHLDQTLAFITVGIMPLFLLLSRLYVGRMRRLTRKVKDSESNVQSMLQETIQHRTLIKTLEGCDAALSRICNTQNVLKKDVINRTKFSLFSNFVVNFGFAAGYIVAFLWSTLRMSGGTLTFGGMAAFLQLVSRIQSPARKLAQLVPTFVNVFTAAERLIELEEFPIEEEGEPIQIKGMAGLRLDNVSYRYPNGDRDILSNLSFDFAPGSITAVVGETGIGKTTLIRIFMSLLTPDKGKIEIYSNEESMNLTSRMLCNFVYVPQGNNLLSGTIRDNLLMGDANASEKDMARVLKKACAEFVFTLPDGLETRCGERGNGLSEGQAQRIAVARALLRKGSIIILDEATSALDPDTEKTMLNNILADRSKTLIMITHRPEVAQRCDSILRL